MTRPSTHIPRSVSLTMEAARRLGMDAELIDPESNHLLELRHAGAVRRVLGSLTGLNSAVAARLSQDKMYTEIVLGRAGFATPRSARCLQPGTYEHPAYAGAGGLSPGLELARERGFPLMVKPNRMAAGRAIFEVHDRDELERAVRAVWQHDYLALVQDLVPGWDLRVNLLDGALLVAYWRRPTVLLGDGRHTLGDLLCAADARFADPAFLARAAASPTFSRAVVARGMNLGTVLARGQRLDLGERALDPRYFAGLEVLERVPRAWLEWCADIARTMALCHVGIDLKVPSPGPGQMPDLCALAPHSATVLETNAAPTVNRLASAGHEERALAVHMRVLQRLFA